MQITLIRHLPTAWNQKTWLQGSRDIEILPPSENDLKKISCNQQTLSKLSPFDTVLASSLKRTQQTAMLYRFNPEIEPLLNELDFGPFEGLPKEQLMKVYEKQWTENPRELALGESLIDFEKRILSFLEKYRGFQNVLVFGHGSWIRALVSYSINRHINDMNKIIVGNNECITLSLEHNLLSSIEI